MKRIFLLLISGMILLNACKKQEKTDSSNPFFTQWDTPFQVPPFDKIENSHYLPAVKELPTKKKLLLIIPFWRWINQVIC